MKQAYLLVVVVFAAATLGTTIYTIHQTDNHRRQLISNLDYRSSLLTDGLRESVEPGFAEKSDAELQGLVEKYSQRQRIAGIGIVNEQANVLAASSSLPQGLPEAKQIAGDAMDSGENQGDFTKEGELYAFASPLYDDEKIIGALVVVQRAGYIGEELQAIWVRNFTIIFLQLLLTLAMIWLIFRWFIYKPIRRLRAIINVSRMANDDRIKVPKDTFLDPILEELTHIQDDLQDVRKMVNQQAQDKHRPKNPK